jgi:predicted HicB family RNase H-like nuclease
MKEAKFLFRTNSELYQKLKEMATDQGVSLNKLINTLAVSAVEENNALDKKEVLRGNSNT